MPRYIDVDAFRMEYGMSERCEDCKSNQKECQYNDYSKRDFCGWLYDAPPVNAVPLDKLCEWLENNASMYHGTRVSRHAWKQMITSDLKEENK